MRSIEHKSTPKYINLLAGSTTGFFTTLLFQPFEVIKTRIQESIILTTIAKPDLSKLPPNITRFRTPPKK